VPFRHPFGGHAHVFLPQELTLIVGAAVLAALAFWNRLALRFDAMSAVVGALALLEIVSSAHADNPWLGLRAASVWGAGLLVFLIARSLAERGSIATGLTGILIPVGIAAGTVVLEALGLTRLSTSHHAPGGLLGERNVAAELLVCAAPVVAWAAVAEGSLARRRIALVVACGATCAIVLGRTRAAWLAALVLAGFGVAFALRSTDRRVRTSALVTGGGALAGILLALAMPIKLRWVSGHPYRDTFQRLMDGSSGSGAGRLVQYATTWRMANAHPLLGVGPGNWAGHYLAFAGPRDPTVHSGFSPVNRLPNTDYLGFLAERGFLAALLFVLLGALLLRQFGPWDPLRRATLLAVAIVGTLDAVLQTPAALVLVAWVLGLTSGSATPPARSARWPFAAMSVGMLVLAIPAACRVAAFYRVATASSAAELERGATLDPGDVEARLMVAESWIADGRCDRARPHLEVVARYNPISPARRELEAQCAREPGSKDSGPRR
jgi:O-antigen ligase